MNFKFPYKFTNQKLLEKALTHRSYLNEHKGEKLESNERLEYLGDAVLELITSLYLYHKYPKFTEGQLTNRRAKLVQTKTLALAAQKLSIGKYLRFSKGEKKSGGNKNISILADTFEALIGAIYEDGGFLAAYDFALKNLLVPAKELFADKLPFDFKSTYQEVVQAHKEPTPTYKTIGSSGPDHNKVFKVALFVGDRKITTALGKSKQEAEQAAAKKALEKLKKK